MKQDRITSRATASGTVACEDATTTRSRRAYDHIVQGVAGVAGMQARSADAPPEHIRNIVCDKLTAQQVAQGITAALLARERGCGGQHLRVSMLDATIAFFWPDGGMNETLLGDEIHRQPLLATSYRIERAADGFYDAVVLTDAQAHGLFRALGRPDLIDDPRFATLEARLQHLGELEEEIDLDEIASRSRDEVVEAMVAEGVPCGPVYRVEEVPNDPQVLANGTFAEVSHPKLGRMRQPRPPLRFAEERRDPGEPAPELGEHSDAVLAELAGLDDSAIRTLREAGIVA